MSEILALCSELEKHKIDMHIALPVLNAAS